MMRLIDKDTIYRQDAVEALKNAEPLVRDFGYYKVIETIRLLPSAEPQKKGKWELHTDERFDIDYYKCSECGYEPYRKMDISNFCPSCGADMRGDNR